MKVEPTGWAGRSLDSGRAIDVQTTAQGERRSTLSTPLHSRTYPTDRAVALAVGLFTMCTYARDIFYVGMQSLVGYPFSYTYKGHT